MLSNDTRRDDYTKLNLKLMLRAASMYSTKEKLYGNKFFIQKQE